VGYDIISHFFFFFFFFFQKIQSRQKFENTNDEWNRALSHKQQEPSQTTKKNLFRSSRTPFQVRPYIKIGLPPPTNLLFSLIKLKMIVG
jgi:hypothetical protein